MAIVLVNGINTHGEGNVDLLGRELHERGHDIVDVRLPKRHTISAWWGAAKDAEAILKMSSEGDVIVGHSFGCLRAAHAMKKREYKAAFMIAPAMRKSWQFENPARVWCFYSPSDWVVWLGSLIPGHPFGKAGVRGYLQLEAYGHNIEMQSDHDDYFGGDLISKVVDRIDRVASE